MLFFISNFRLIKLTMLYMSKYKLLCICSFFIFENILVCQPVLVKDIAQGNATFDPGSYPTNLCKIDDYIFFTASDALGNAIFKYNYQTDAVSLVERSILESGQIIDFININGELFFSLTKGDYGTELWKSDGTHSGTVLIKGFYNYIISTTTSLNFTNVKGTLFFTADDGIHGTELWKSDGTSNGTILLKDINSGIATSSPANFTNVKGTLFFTANDGINGCELWKSDGTSNGTTLVKDINSGNFSSSPTLLTNVRDILFFTADDGIHGGELWRSDGTSAGTILVKDIASGTPSSYLDRFINVNGTLFFTSFGDKLWKSDGTDSGTLLVTNKASYCEPRINADGTLFFTANAGVNGTELWKSDGTESGTVMVKVISYMRDFIWVNNILFICAQGDIRGLELWKSDGTNEGTMLVKDINPIYGKSSYPSNFIDLNDRLLFTADNGINGTELWKSDGTETGTVMVKNIFSNIKSSNPSNFFNINNKLVFMASDGNPDGSMVKHLWTTDGTETGTVLLKDIACGMAEDIQKNINGTLFFGGGNDWELWKTDGTPEGTNLVKNILQNGSSCPQDFGEACGKLIFTAITEMGPPPYYPIDSVSIFISDGTTEGTTPVNIPNAGTCFSGSVDLNKNSFIFCSNKIYQSNESFDEVSIMKDFNYTEPGCYVYSPFRTNNSLMFFSIYNGNVSQSSALWKSNGTSYGTVLLMDSFRNYIQNFTNVNGILYFTADDGIHGTELWKSDGTINGTKLVKDIFPGLSNSIPANLIAFNGKLYFTADDGIHGSALWVSDGTSGGTFFIKEGSCMNMLVHNNNLYFTTATQDGIQLWKSDGTSKGTFALENLTSGAYSSVSNLLIINNTLYFARYDDVYGNELWKYILPIDSVNSTTLNNYKIYPNPAHDMLYIYSQNEYQNENKHIIISDISGHTIFKDDVKDDFLNISFLTNGIYIISINNTKYKIIKI